MKKVFPFLLFVLAVAAVAAFSYLSASPEGFALAMAIPLLPRDMFSRRPMINRDITLNSGTFGLGGEELVYPIYDRMLMSAAQAVNQRTLFKTSVGSQRENATLTYADTNIVQSEQVPSSQKWKLSKLTIQYIAIAPRADTSLQFILNYVRTTYFELSINSKDSMFILPLWMFFGTPQLVSAPAVTVNSRYPQAMFSGVWDFSDVPIVLQANTNWGIYIQPLAASNAALDGDFISMVFGSTRARAD